MPLIAGTGKPRIILGTMTLYVVVILTRTKLGVNIEMKWP